MHTPAAGGVWGQDPHCWQGSTTLGCVYPAWLPHMHSVESRPSLSPQMVHCGDFSDAIWPWNFYILFEQSALCCAVAWAPSLEQSQLPISLDKLLQFGLSVFISLSCRSLLLSYSHSFQSGVSSLISLSCLYLTFAVLFLCNLTSLSSTQLSLVTASLCTFSSAVLAAQWALSRSLLHPSLSLFRKEPVESITK